MLTFAQCEFSQTEINCRFHLQLSLTRQSFPINVTLPLSIVKFHRRLSIFMTNIPYSQGFSAGKLSLSNDSNLHIKRLALFAVISCSKSSSTRDGCSLTSRRMSIMSILFEGTDSDVNLSLEIIRLYMIMSNSELNSKLGDKRRTSICNVCNWWNDFSKSAAW